MIENYQKQLINVDSELSSKSNAFDKDKLYNLNEQKKMLVDKINKEKQILLQYQQRR